MSMIEDHSFFAKLDKADDLLKQGQYGEALAVLENIFTRYPEEEPVLLRLAWASWDSGDKERSVAYWEMLLDRELQRKIFTGFAYDELVRIYKQENQIEKLAAVCEKAVAVQPDDAALLLELGNARLQAGNAMDACRIYEKLVQLEDDNPDYHCRLGEALFAAGCPAESEAAYRQAGKIDPERADRYYFRIADLFARNGRHSEAIRLLEACIMANPVQPLHYCCLGDELAALGRIQEAWAVYETAVTYDPSGAGAYYNRLGNTLMKEKIFDRAAGAFQKAIEREPLAPFYGNLASAYEAMGQFQLAEDALMRAGAVR